MKTRILTTALLVLCSFVVCFAAITGLNGKWKGTIKVSDENELELTYNFKVDGEKLTGTVKSSDEELPISNGILTHDVFTFNVKVGELVIAQTGKYYGDSVVVSADVEGKTLSTTLKRNK
jgi:hypothetical protein